MPQISRIRSRRAWAKLMGFTLAEILVALALIALLAAVLLPTVAGQILKGDAARVTQDLDAIRTGIDQFLADVHRYPGRYSDLNTKISTDDTKHIDINATKYTTGLVAKWAGPYVMKDTAIGAYLETGYGGQVQNILQKTLHTNSVNYVTVRIFGIAEPDFLKIDAQIDGASSTSTIAKTTGLLRWGTNGTIDTTRFLATPIQ